MLNVRRHFFIIRREIKLKEFLSQNWIGALISLSGILIGAIISFIFYRKSFSKAIPGYQYKSLDIIDVSEKINIDNINVFYKDTKIDRLLQLTHNVQK